MVPWNLNRQSIRKNNSRTRVSIETETRCQLTLANHATGAPVLWLRKRSVPAICLACVGAPTKAKNRGLVNAAKSNRSSTPGFPFTGLVRFRPSWTNCVPIAPPSETSPARIAAWLMRLIGWQISSSSITNGPTMDTAVAVPTLTVAWVKANSPAAA